MTSSKTISLNKLEQDFYRPFYFQLSGACDDGDSKDWITPTLCIGNASSSYEPFHVVVNADYPNNRSRHKTYGRREEEMGKTKCTLYLVGLCDHDTEKENLEGCIAHLIPRLRKRYEENSDTKFLFHCFAGKSRSVALALAFMVEVQGMSFEDALQLVKEKRPIIEPRISFIDMLRQKYTKV